MTRTTIIFLALAGVSAAGAYSMRPVEVPPVEFDEVGLPLFEAFTDPSQAHSLEVQTWDKEASGLRKFAVAYKEGRWVIPSHNDYPADASKRMGEAASSFIGVTKDQVRSDSADEHAEFGVQDPASAEGTDEGRGIRFTIADASGTKLVDVIVGKNVPDRPGYRYVRLPDSDRVYTARLELNVSTKFTDWVEQDLLKVESDSIVAIVSNSYTVDEETGRVLDHQPMRFEKRPGADGGAEDWQLVGPPEGASGLWPIGTGPVLPPPPGKTLDVSKVRQIISGVDYAKLAGVRPQPERLTQDALMRVGFFVSPDLKKLYGNEGEISILCRDGVVYTLYFGAISYQTGEALTAGGEAEAPAEGGEGKAHRYMFVNVSYDRALDQTAPAPPAPAEGAPAAAPPEEPTEGQKRAESLRKRFDRWFYVVANSSFDQMHKTPADFWKDAGG